jgi:nucleotide-binding universal stress UspA family protein
MLPIKAVLYPTDFSDCAAYAFELASCLAGDYRARLVILHVYVPSVIAFGEMPPVPPVPVDDQKAAQARLEQLQPYDRSVLVETVMREGDPATEILRLAQEMPCDLIVMGTHGRTGLPRLLMGSVAEEVLRNAVCPVLTVKSAPVESARHETSRKEA